MKTNFLSLKNIFLVKHWWLVLLTLNFNIFSQTSPPESISYQGVARDAAGNILSNQPIGIQFLIHQGSPSGTVVFYETHSTSTNAVGIFTLAIGSVNTSTFQSIPWNNGPYYLEVQMDPTGGSSFTPIGTQQLLSVPYALYAKSSYTAAGSFSSAISYSTNNAPPISINSNTSASSTTLTFSQGSNSSSVAINFPPPPPANITMSSSGIVSVSPTSGNAFTLDVPPPTLNVTSGTSDATISITQGSITTTQTLSFPPTSINGIGTGIASTTISGNSFTVDVPSPSLSVASGASDATITITQGTATTTQTLSFPPASVPNVSINATGIVTVAPNSGTAFTIGAPTPTITSGTGINVSGTYPNINITNTAPDQTVNLNAGTNVTVNGSYPNFTVNSAPTLSISGNTLSISGGNNVTLPSSPTPTITGTGIAAVTPTTGNNFTVNVPTQTLSITGSPTSYTLSSNLGGSVPLPSPTLSINSPHTVAPLSGYAHTINIKPPDLITPSPNNIASVTSNTSTLQYSITVPSPTLSISTATTGVSTLTLTQGPATSTVSIPSPTNYAWGLKGNTASAADFLGTTNNADLIFKTNNTENMRITSGGNVGIGTTTPSAKLHINSSLTTPALQIDNNNGHSIYIQNNGTSGSAVYAWLSNPSNNDPAIYSYVAGGGGSAVYAKTDGTGAAVRAVAGTASNLALHIDNGHIKSTMSATPTIAIGMVGGGFYSTTVSLETGSNDVRGTVSMTTSVSPPFASGNMCEVQVNFAKPYNSVPYVVVCPAGSLGTDMQGLSFTVRAVTSSFFRIAIYKSDNMTSPTSIPPNSTFSFNYFVIE